MIHHIEINDKQLHKKIRKKEILFGGNKRLKIYGALYCSSGKRMNRENRVFFGSEKEAIKNDYRPCGHCMKEKYKNWQSRDKITKN